MSSQHSPSDPSQQGAEPPEQHAAWPAHYLYRPPSSNPWAWQALIVSFLALGFSLVTLVSLVGFAGLATGAVAIHRGITALRLAKRLPNKCGHTMAIVALVMGMVAWVIVLISFVLRIMTRA